MLMIYTIFALRSHVVIFNPLDLAERVVFRTVVNLPPSF